jgi:hypothetical protein
MKQNKNNNKRKETYLRLLKTFSEIILIILQIKNIF